MKHLYIIGNGFDLHHELPTQYSDFHDYVINNDIGLENDFEEFFNFKINENYKWKDFETDMGTFDSDSFYKKNCHINIQDDNFKQSMTYSLKDDIDQEIENLISRIREAFTNWIEEVEFDSVVKKYSFKSNSYFINFNYTLLLEKLFKIEKDKILHIHGDTDSGRDSIIFGHRNKIDVEPEIDENGDSNRTIFSDSISASKYLFYNFYKDVEDIINAHEKFLLNLKDIEKIIILGHSLSNIDILYFKEISNRLEAANVNNPVHATACL